MASHPQFHLDPWLPYAIETMKENEGVTCNRGNFRHGTRVRARARCGDAIA